MSQPDEPADAVGGPVYQQVVIATGGFAYGVMGADLHVIQGDGPVYVLTEHHADALPQDVGGIPAQPGQLLAAQRRVVGFSDRDREWETLSTWRDGNGARMAAMWLHGPGGQGKTRLAIEFADASASASWKVVIAEHGAGRKQPRGQDLQIQDSVGLLLIIDYADRWSLDDLRWLFSNALLDHQVPTRLLLLARSTGPWPAIRGSLTQRRAATSELQLAAVAHNATTQDRRRIFTTARDCFASRYGITDPTRIKAPPSLQHPSFGNILSLHMAALVRVDAYARGLIPPRDPADLSAYLLDREYMHWESMYESGLRGADFQTPRGVMARVVFTAALAGPATYEGGTALLDSLALEVHTARLLTDHVYCYPTPNEETVLEPLYPDRLAEDFLALTLPGAKTMNSTIGAARWAAATLRILTARPSQGSVPTHIARTVTFLAAAAGPDRWPHVARHLNTLLRTDPALALAAGNGALALLAKVPDLEVEALTAVAETFPDTGVPGLAPGIADLTARLASERLSRTSDHEERSRIYMDLGHRLSNADRHGEALEAAFDAVDALDAAGVSSGATYARALQNKGAVLYSNRRFREAVEHTRRACAKWRSLAIDGTAFLREFAHSLGNLGTHLQAVGEHREALTVCTQAVRILRFLNDDDELRDTGHQQVISAADLADGLGRLGSAYFRLGYREQAFEAARDVVALYTWLESLEFTIGRNLHDHSHDFEPALAQALEALGGYLAESERPHEALEPLRKAADLHKKLAQEHADLYETRAADSLSNLAAIQAKLERNQEARESLENLLETYERLAATRGRTMFVPDIARVLNNLGPVYAALGQHDLALETAERSAAAYRLLADEDPVNYEFDFTRALNNLGQRQSAGALHPQAADTLAEAVQIRRRLAAAEPAAYEPQLARTLASYAQVTLAAGRHDAAQTAVREALRVADRWAKSEPDTYSGLQNMIRDLADRILRARNDVQQSESPFP